MGSPSLAQYADVEVPPPMPSPPSWYHAHPPSPPCLATVESKPVAARSDPSGESLFNCVSWAALPRAPPPSCTCSDSFLISDSFNQNPFRVRDCAKGLFMPIPSVLNVVGADTVHVGAHSAEMERRLAEAEEVMLAETLAEEEAEKRRVIEDRRAEARRAAADKVRSCAAQSLRLK